MTTALETIRVAARDCHAQGNTMAENELLGAAVAFNRLIKAAEEMMQQDAVQRTTFSSNPFMADAADHLSFALREVNKP